MRDDDSVSLHVATRRRQRIRLFEAVVGMHIGSCQHRGTDFGDSRPASRGTRFLFILQVRLHDGKNGSLTVERASSAAPIHAIPIVSLGQQISGKGLASQR